jgi:hypothetical protein
MEGSGVAVDGHGNACKQPAGPVDALFERNFYNVLSDNKWED